MPEERALAQYELEQELPTSCGRRSSSRTTLSRSLSSISRSWTNRTAQRAGCQTRWTKDYFQNLPDEVQECFEEQALAEKDQLKGEGLTRSVEDLATKVGGDENSNEGGDEIVSAGKGKNLAVKSESSVVSGGGGTVSGV